MQQVRPLSVRIGADGESPGLCACLPSVTEIVGSKQRRIVGIVIQMFFTLGIIILPGIAYFIPNWQGIQLAITLPNFLFLLYYW